MKVNDWLPAPPVGEEPGSNLVDPAQFLVDHASTLSHSLEEIDALRAPYVIDNFVRRGGILMLGAESKSRKSWLAQDAALSVADGTHWLADEVGHHGFTVAQAKSHIFDLELDSSELMYRFARTRLERYRDPESARHVTDAFRHYSLAGESSIHTQEIIEGSLGTIKPGDMVVVDCFYRLCADSNDTAEVSNLFTILKGWAKRTQAAWIVVDHFRKAGADKAKDRFNGTFMKAAAPDCLLAVECRKDGIYELNIDARSFFGPPRVWCTWDNSHYRFVQRSSIDVAAAKSQMKRTKAAADLALVWAGEDPSVSVVTKTAASCWRITEQAARDRFRLYEGEGFVKIVNKRPARYLLTSQGIELIQAKGENL